MSFPPNKQSNEIIGQIIQVRFITKLGKTNFPVVFLLALQHQKDKRIYFKTDMDVSKKVKSIGKIGISVLKCWVTNSIFQNTFPVIDFYGFDIYLLLILHILYQYQKYSTSKTPTRLSTKLVCLIFTNLQGAILSVELMPLLCTNTILLDTFTFIVEHLDYFKTVYRSATIKYTPHF